jgi:hypothetical protein
MVTNASTETSSSRLTWSAIQQVYSADLAEHFAGAQASGLECPVDVFEQLFHDHHDDSELAEVLRFVDWSAVRWEEGDFSGVALRRLGVPRPFERAVDEARWRTAEEGFSDERPEVMWHWSEARTWSRAPIIVAGEVWQSGLDELIVGFTRLGNVLGALDRQDLPESNCHRVWVGRPA